MQQIYTRTLMPKCSFNKVAKKLYWNRTSARLSSYIFRTPFPRSTSGWLLLMTTVKTVLSEVKLSRWSPCFSINNFCRKQLSIGVLRKCVLKICSKFTGESPCWSVISIKLQSKNTLRTPLDGCFCSALPEGTLGVFV